MGPTQGFKSFRKKEREGRGCKPQARMQAKAALQHLPGLVLIPSCSSKCFPFPGRFHSVSYIGHPTPRSGGVLTEVISLLLWALSLSLLEYPDFLMLPSCHSVFTLPLLGKRDSESLQGTVTIHMF